MRRRVGVTLAGLVLVTGLFLALPEPDAPPPEAWPEQPGNGFVLRGVDIFDGERFLPRQVVRVEDGVIIAVGSRVAAPPGLPEFVAAGCTLLPALIDAHTHNFPDTGEDALRFGVGTQIDLFTRVEMLTEAHRQRAAGGRVAAADMWSAGTLVTAPGGHGTQFGLPIPTLTGAAEADAFIADRLAEGSDFIKVVLEHGHGWGGGLPTLGPDVLAAVVRAARSRHRRVVAHVGTGEEARLAVECGVDGLAHLFGDEVITADLVDRIRQQDVFVIPTLTVLESMSGRDSGLGGDGSFTPWLSAAQSSSLGQRFPARVDGSRLIERAMVSVRLLFEAGVPILAGTDAPNPGTAHGVSLHRELALLVEAGLPPAAALTAATATPARHFGLTDRGRVAPGCRADLLLVAGDPLADITVTRRIVAVWKNGYRIERPRPDESLATAPPLSDPVLGRFETGADQWGPTTDSVQGGRSEVRIEVAEGRLVVQGEVRPGALWPWAGAMRTLGGPAMAPVDLSGWEGLELRLRGEGAVQVMFLTGDDPRAIPAVVAVPLSADWRATRIGLFDVPGLDRRRVRAVGVVAGPGIGPVRFEIGPVVLR